jgi:hypothetical protein
MHDPYVVAFEIRRPWPRRVHWGTRRWYFPPIITVWHVEPGGHDSGEICRHYDRETKKITNGWRWHVWHWKLQIHREVRVIAAVYGVDADEGSRECYSCSDKRGDDIEPYPCPTVRLLALPYADRPGYRDEWRP